MAGEYGDIFGRGQLLPRAPGPRPARAAPAQRAAAPARAGGRPAARRDERPALRPARAVARRTTCCCASARGNNLDTPGRMKFEIGRVLPQERRRDGARCSRTSREAIAQHAADRRDDRPRAAARASCGSRISRCPTARRSRPGCGRSASAASSGATATVTPELQQRLDYELGVITSMGYAGYFLIVADFVRFAREQGIQTTCRGSAPGSIVTYTLGITPVDPIHYQLPFERFLNPDRVTMPDIDVDFEDDRRDEVIAYVASQVRPGPRRPDHHVRHDARPGRDPRRRAGARPQLRRGRPDREGGARTSSGSGSTRRSRSRPQLREQVRRGPGGQAGHRLRPAARGRRPQRVDARGRRRHQPRAADRADAAPEGDELRLADDAVRDARRSRRWAC